MITFLFQEHSLLYLLHFQENQHYFYNLQTLELKFKSFKSSLTKRFKNIEKFQEVLRNCYIPLDDILKENFQWQCGKIKKFYGYQDVSARVTKGVEPINFIFDEIIACRCIFSPSNFLIFLL